MERRFIPATLISALFILHGQLWFGRGSVPTVAKMASALELQNRNNAQAALANERLTEEIRDLREGLEIVEEKARSELGMVKANEIYVQLAK